jgi:transposase
MDIFAEIPSTMGKVYRGYEPDQMLLLPPSLKDWLPEGHLAFFISDAVDQLDISDIQNEYEKELRGYPPYHPRMMLKILVYGYCVGVRSSRKIARRVEEDVAFRFLAGGNMPKFRSIAEFRQRHLRAFRSLFLQVLLMCHENGLVKLGHVALDGTKVKANASKHKAMSYGRMKTEEERLAREIDEMVREAANIDESEDRRFGRDKRGDELPEELAHRETRLRKIREAMETLKKRAEAEAEAKGERKDDDRPPEDASPKPTDQVNFTDADSRIMVDSNKSFVQAYNAQAAVDSESQVIVANDVTNQSNDKKQVKPMVSNIRSNLGAVPDHLSADAGYFSESNVKWLIQERVAPYIPPRKQKHNDPRVTPRGPITPDMTVAELMERKLRTKRGREFYRKRKAIVEPVFGQIKEAMGFRQFLLRGLAKVKAEWDLICMCHNLRKMHLAGAKE